MKTLKTAQALLAVALLSLAGSAFATSYTGAFDAPVPDNDAAGISSTISIADAGVITALTVDVTIDHTWVGDLIMTLTAPDGSVISLLDRPGFIDTGFGTNADVVSISFDDAALTAAEDVLDDDGDGFIDDSVLAPNDSLATFVGLDLAGDWTLTISDNAGGDTNLVAPTWAINANTAVVPVPAAVWLMLSAIGGLGFLRRK